MQRQAPSARARWLAALPPWLRGAALMPLAALAVHQLRYELAFGADAPRALAAQGHAYLSSLTPWLVLLAALGAGAWLGALAQRWAAGATVERPSRRAVRGVGTWLTVTVALLVVYGGQELLEGAFAAGHPTGVAAVLGGGGWWALPAALAVGGALTLVLRAGAAAEDALVELRPLRLALRARDAAGQGVRPTMPTSRPRHPLARAAAGRAPPATARLAIPA